VPQWWGLHLEGQLIQVIYWREATRPTLEDFGARVPSGSEYEIAPLRVSAAE
jgi:hypothetical protein